MNKEKILNWVKENKKGVGIIGGALVAVLLLGGGYGIYKYTNKASTVAENNILEAQKSIAENTSDSSNDNKDGQKDNGTDGQADNQENTSDNKIDSNTTENKQENKDEKSSSSENNKKDDVNQGENKTSSQDGKSTVTIATESGNKQTNPSNTSSNVVNKPANKPNGNTNPSHSHNWTPIKKTVHHKEQGHYENVVVKPAWTEKVPVYEEREVSICKGCDKDITQNPYKHVEDQALEGNYKCGSWYNDWKNVQVGTKTVKHDAVYKKKWVVDKKAYDETVTTGYKCSCGATK